MLNVLGHEVELAGSGREAVEMYERRQDRFDPVIPDIGMPEMGGGATHDRLKRINPEIKALLSSGYSIDGEAGEILKRGCRGFIQKPFDLDELSMKIKEILRA